MASNPMQQFSVHKIGPEIKLAGVDLSFTNASLFMVISASIILLFLFFGTKERKIIRSCKNARQGRKKKKKRLRLVDIKKRKFLSRGQLDKAFKKGWARYFERR